MHCICRNLNQRTSSPSFFVCGVNDIISLNQHHLPGHHYSIKLQSSMKIERPRPKLTSIK